MSTAMAAVCLVAAVLPWLNPWASGPSAVVQPWMVAAALTLLLWVVVAPAVRARELAAALALGVALVGIGAATPPTLMALGGLAIIGISACVAAAMARDGRVGAVIADAWLVAALVSSALALFQYFGLATHLAPWVNSTEPGEAFANLRQRNQFATLTSIGLASLLWRVRQGGRG